MHIYNEIKIESKVQKATNFHKREIKTFCSQYAFERLEEEKNFKKKYTHYINPKEITKRLLINPPTVRKKEKELKIRFTAINAKQKETMHIHLQITKT